jgi:hypothetical protein
MDYKKMEKYLTENKNTPNPFPFSFFEHFTDLSAILDRLKFKKCRNSHHKSRQQADSYDFLLSSY